MNKCKCTVIDPYTKKNRKCKLKFTFLKMCYIHLKQQEKKISLIQATWKSYKARKIINTIYIKLPCDIQRLIIAKMNITDNILKKYIPSVKKIYISKLEKNIVESQKYKNLRLNNEITFDVYCKMVKKIIENIEKFSKYFHFYQDFSLNLNYLD
jgi:hypothetical protein